MRIVPYDKKYRDEFVKLNFEWIDKMFKIELINVQDLIVITNTKCEAAIHLYKEFGFKQVPVDKELFPFKRANVQMELTI